MVIDLVPLGDSTPRSSQADDKIAEGICLALHLFLSITHRQKHRRRTQIPPPISNQKLMAPPYHLLRPLVTRMNHQSAVDSVHKLFKPLCTALASAKISPEPTYDVVSTPPQAAFIKGLSATETVISSLTDRLESVTTFKVTERTSIIIKSVTNMYTVCSTHFISLSPESPLNITCKAPPPVNHWSKAEEYVLYATSCALASSFTQSVDQNDDAGSWEPTVASDILRKPSADGAGGNGKQLLFQAEFMKGIAKLRVRWEHVSVIHGYGNNTPSNGNGAKKEEGMYEWKSSGSSSKKSDWEDGEGEVVRSLQDVVDEAGRS
jgi:mediator of RNA polymerase II transcription subunit 17